MTIQKLSVSNKELVRMLDDAAGDAVACCTCPNAGCYHTLTREVLRRLDKAEEFHRRCQKAESETVVVRRANEGVVRDCLLRVEELSGKRDYWRERFRMAYDADARKAAKAPSFWKRVFG